MCAAANGDLGRNGTAPSDAIPPERELWRAGYCRVPNYVVDDWGPELKAAGLALFLALSRHAGKQDQCWPSYSLLAAETGMARGTVVRLLRRLEEVGLIRKLGPGPGKGGRRSNLYQLTDPPPRINAGEGAPDDPRGHLARPLGSSGAPSEGAPDDPRGHLARPLSDGSTQEQDPGGRGARAPCAAPEAQMNVGRLTVLWMDLLTNVRPEQREQHGGEVAAELAELLRLGYSPEHLRSSIEEPTRQRWEWPREWRARVASKPPQPTKTPLTPAEVAQRAAEAAEEARLAEEARIEFLGGKTFSERMKERQAARGK